MKNILAVLLFIFTWLCFADSHAWVAPIGVPDPEWGIETDVTDLYGAGSGATYDYSDDEPTGAVAYRTNASGEPYTYYSDPDHPSCTDTSNPHGTTTTPRCHRPNGPFVAGDVIEIHNDSGVNMNWGQFSSSGTADAPIFIRGTSSDKPTFLGQIMSPDADYIIIENVKVDMNRGTNPVMYIGYYDNASTHIAIRDCEIYNGQADPSSSYQVIRAKLDPGELMPNTEDRDFSSASAWADVDLASGGGSYDESDDLTLSAGGAGAGDYCALPVASAPTTATQDCILTMDVDAISGSWTIKSFDGTQTIGTISSTGAYQQWTWTATTTGGLRLEAAENSASITIDDLSLNDHVWSQNIIFYNNVFHDIGEENDGDADAVCISIDGNVKNVWVLNNTFYNIGGDGFQAAWDGYATSHSMPQYIYFAKNTGHDLYENLIDTKMVRDVIVSQNTAYNMGPAYSDITKNGNMPFRFGLGEGPSGIDKSNIWVLFNYAYNMDPVGNHCVFNHFDYSFDQQYGPRYGTDIYFIGNVVANANTSSNDGYAYCINQALNAALLNNVAYNVDAGIYFVGDRTDEYASESVAIENNIIHTADVSILHLLATDSSWGNWTMRNNLFYDPESAGYKISDYPDGGGSPSITSYTDFHDSGDLFCDDFDGDPHPNFCGNSDEDNPDFTDPGNGVFLLQAASPAIGAGSGFEAAAAAFETRYGLNIRYDWDGLAWGGSDIGAFKYTDGMRVSEKCAGSFSGP